MSNKYLYPFCNSWCESGSVWFYSDPHFNDPDSKKFRTSKGNYISDEEQIKRINSKCGKQDTLVLLGDIGDLSYVSKLRAKRKILVMGNHESGKSNYEKKVISSVKIESCPCCGSKKINHNYVDFWYNECSKCGYTSTDSSDFYDVIEKTNGLFDEVYDGWLTIRKDMVISHHQRSESPYCFNLHGHEHSNDTLLKQIKELAPIVAPNLDFNKDQDKIEIQLKVCKHLGLKQFNCCAEWIGYYPVNLSYFIQSGILKNIPDKNREQIDKSSSKKKK